LEYHIDSIKKNRCVTEVTQRYFALSGHSLPITDGCWSGKAMLLQERSRFSQQVLALPALLLLEQVLPLASVLELPLLALQAF
jgi:hypothetical protein